MPTGLSEQLRLGAVTPVFHATQDAATLRELVRDYLNLVDDATRTKLRIKALFRARGIRTVGRSVFSRDQRTHWIEQLSSAGEMLSARLLGRHARIREEHRRIVQRDGGTWVVDAEGQAIVRL